MRRVEFWVVQALVVGISAGHAINEWQGVVDLHGAEFLPVSLYLLPVVYASLAFGMRGAAPTAIWAFALTLPNVALWHDGTEAVGELWQASLVLAVGLFIGARVDRERQARRQAESRERERRASEDRYRGLFDVAADAILLLDAEGRILEANAAAQALFDRSPGEADHVRVAELDPGLWRALSSEGGQPPGPVAIAGPSGPIWVQTIAVRFQDAKGEPRLLAQLHDVTLARERERLLESFARDAVAAREEERRRVARDLHDGPLQSLVLLWRALDGLGDSPGPAATRSLEEARARIEQVADELRGFSRDLRPSVLDDLGLAPALNAVAVSFEGRCGLPTTFKVEGEVRHRLPLEIELTLLRICEEALRNVERHARAQKVEVRLEVRGGIYRLSVRDDGVGIGSLPPQSELVRAGRLGVVGMHERARLVGATCTMRSLERGTLVEVIGHTHD